MPVQNTILTQINSLTSSLIEVGLSIDQNFAYIKNYGENCYEVTFPNSEYVRIALKERPYNEIYSELRLNRAYSIMMPDGALIQMMYKFEKDNISLHRLTFFPSPHLDQFQNFPDLYLEDSIYADIISKQIVPFPLRFDFSSDLNIFKEIEHPKTHLTLGQYENCRIPVTAPLTPYWFIFFILQNFYHSAYIHFMGKIPEYKTCFQNSINKSEREVIHLCIPN